MNYEAQLMEALALGINAALSRLAYACEPGEARKELLGYCQNVADALEAWRESRRPWHATNGREWENQDRIADS